VAHFLAKHPDQRAIKLYKGLPDEVADENHLEGG